MPLTATAWDNFKIRQGTREPGSYRIGMGMSAAALQGYLPSSDLDTILNEGVETAGADNDTGRINRTLPVAHPKRANLFLRILDNIQGVNFIEKVASDPEGLLEAPPIPYYANYTYYEFQASFESRPYTLISNDAIPSYSISYFDAAGAPQTKSAWKEEWRYTEWVRQPAAEYLTADKGQWRWAVPGGGGGADPTDNTSAGVGQIRVLISSATWKVIWHAVPYNYVLSDKSYFDQYMGHVNQQDWQGFKAGHGLLQAVNVLRIYEPPFPSFENFTGRDTVSQEKLCDLELVILEARRTPSVAVTPSNASHIASGHNCTIYAPNSKYYYVENFRSGAAGSGKPIYPSVPFDLFFQNPDGPP